MKPIPHHLSQNHRTTKIPSTAGRMKRRRENGAGVHPYRIQPEKRREDQDHPRREDIRPSDPAWQRRQWVEQISVLQHHGDHQGALALARRLTRADPNHLHGFQLLTLSCLRLGRHREALDSARRALRLNPGNPLSSLLMARAETDNGLDNDALIRLAELLDTDLGDQERYWTLKELARLLDRLEEYPAVFPTLHQAAGIAAGLPEIQDQDKTRVPAAMVIYQEQMTETLLCRWHDAGFPEDCPAPVIVAGFPCSGADDLCQLLANHPGLAFSDDESRFDALIQALEDYPESRGNVLQRLEQMDFDDIVRWRRWYWQQLVDGRKKIRPGQRILEKITTRSHDLGILLCLFPDARLVLTQRDPRDTLLDSYMAIPAPSPHTVHLFDWESAARFHRLCGEWHDTLKQRLPSPVLEVSFEETILQPEETFSVLADYLELPPLPAKTAPWLSEAGHDTSQAAAIGRWRHYSSEFEPLADLLPAASATAPPSRSN